MWLIDNVKVSDENNNKGIPVKINTMFVLHQIKWSLSKQELLFSDFCEDSDNLEEGAEYNKVFMSTNVTA